MRFTTAAEAVKLIRPHSSVYIQGSTSIPEVLVRAMTDHGPSQWLAVIETLLSSAFFCCAIAYVRLTRSSQK